MNDLDLIKSKLLDYKCNDSYVFSAIKSVESKMELLDKLQKTLYSSELYLVYKHTDPNGKIYIGITKNAPNARWNEGAGYETQKKFYKAIQTFGWINFKHEIIAAGLTEKEARTLESQLIREYQSNDEAYGYNTQVMKMPQQEEKSHPKPQTKYQVNCTDIANQLIQKLSIKTINGNIYYLNDGTYIKEKENPIIKKELLLTYQIESRKQKEIIEQIKILSFSRKEDVFPSITIPNYEIDPKDSVDISAFFKNLCFEKESSYFISDDLLYEKYISFAEEYNYDIKDKNAFHKLAPSWIKRYRLDVCRLITASKKGWELRTIMEDNNSVNLLTKRGIEEISNWLDSTDANIVCVPMICEKALGIKSKGSRKMGNEICFALRNTIPGWEEIGVQRTKEYGNQLCFVKK